MSRSPWLLSLLVFAACAAAETADGSGEDGASCEEGQCDLGDRATGLPTTPVSLPFVGTFKVQPGEGANKPGELAGVDVTLPSGIQGAWVFAQVRTSAATQPPLMLWATKDGNDIATSTAGVPYVGAPVPTGRLTIGVENQSMSPVQGTLSIALSADEAFCAAGGKAGGRAASSVCDGSILRVCATDYLQGNTIRYVQIDCSNRGGCDAAAGKCKSAQFPLFWCEGTKSRALDGRELLGLDNDCGTAGFSCGADGQCKQ